jgi:hypothetical protein
VRAGPRSTQDSGARTLSRDRRIVEGQGILAFERNKNSPRAVFLTWLGGFGALAATGHEHREPVIGTPATEVGPVRFGRVVLADLSVVVHLEDGGRRRSPRKLLRAVVARLFGTPRLASSRAKPYERTAPRGGLYETIGETR